MDEETVPIPYPFWYRGIEGRQNLREGETGLPGILHVCRKSAGHWARVKYYKKGGGPNIVIIVDSPPRIETDNADPEVLRAVNLHWANLSTWIVLNRTTIERFWKDETMDGVELKRLLTKV